MVRSRGLWVCGAGLLLGACSSSSDGDTSGAGAAAGTSSSIASATASVGGGAASGSSATSGTGAAGGGGGTGGAGGGGTVAYHDTCDGSAAVVLGADHFLNANDENQILRVYLAGTNGGPVQTFDLGADIGVMGEADIEDVARIGDRLYWITSHGRKKSGQLDLERYRFFATDLAGAVPALEINVVGYYDQLLHNMLEPASWLAADQEVIALLVARTQFETALVPDLAPKVNGTAIEGLVAAPTAEYPERLVLGLRNPLIDAKAIVVSLLNPDEVIAGTAVPAFGEAGRLDLGGLGIRALTYSTTRTSFLILAGPPGEGGPFRIYSWNGDFAASPAVLLDLPAPPPVSSPEVLLEFPDGTFRTLFDQGDAPVMGNVICKDLLPISAQSFTDAVVDLP